MAKVKGVFRHRYGLTNKNGFLTNVVHNWDGKTFDEHGYPVADCKERLYPRYLGASGSVCNKCFPRDWYRKG